jgi:probable HAF family extracellular repeat protein
MMKPKFFALALFVLLTLLAAGSWRPGTTASAAHPAGYPYTVTDLGVFPGGASSRAYGLNDLGQVVGTAGNPDPITSQGYPDQAFLWLPEPAYGLPAGLNNLGAMGGDYSVAFDINNNGQVTGTADREQGGHAFRWENGTMLDLGDLSDGEGDSTGYGINEAGHVVGETETEDWTTAFLWDGEMTDLDDENRYSEAADINEAGHIVGLWQDENGADRAFFVAGETWIDLGLLGGGHAPSGGDGSRARAINDADQIVGHAATTDGSYVSAFLYLFEPAYNLPAGMNAIATEYSIAYGINNHGQVVGGGEGAFLWECGLTVNLNDLIDPALGWFLAEAQDINEAGQIAGWGIINGETHGFLLTPANGDDRGAGRGNSCVSFSHALYLPAVTH